MNTTLHVAHQLNFDEAVRRLEHWANQKDSSMRDIALRLLAKQLKDNKDCLYFEGE